MLDFSVLENEMEEISIRIEHKNIPLATSNIFVDQMSSEEIICAVARFEHELPITSGDDMLTVTKSSNSVRDQETIYVITSSLEKTELISAIERTLTGLRLGGRIFELPN